MFALQTSALYPQTIYLCFTDRCPKEMSPYVAALTQLCLKFMTFDPNYNYDEDEAEEDSMDIEDGIEEGLSLSL